LFVIHELLHPQYSLKLKFGFCKHTSVKSDIGTIVSNSYFEREIESNLSIKLFAFHDNEPTE